MLPLSISPLKSHAALLVSQLQFYIYPISRNKSIARLLLEHDFLDSFIENNEKILSPLWQLLHQNNDLFSLYFEALFVILIKNHVYSSDRDPHEIHIDLCMKRETKVSQEFLLVKSSENDFIFLLANYLIIWLMKAKKNFEKIAILKTRGLVSFWGVKTHFGKMPLKWCIFRHEKIKILSNICLSFWSN